MRYALFLMALFLGLASRGQTALSWSDLSEGISWEVPSPEAVFPGFQKASFSPEIQALDGKPVLLTGYLLILDGKQSVYLLSMNPMASCFFCGNGGPETIVDLEFAEKTSFSMDELLAVEGILQLNATNPNIMYYGIKEAVATNFK